MPPAIIFSHPRHEVKLQDPRDTFGSDHPFGFDACSCYALPQLGIDTPITASAPPNPELDGIRLERHQRIQTLALEVGSWQQLATMVKNLASIHGYEVK